MRYFHISINYEWQQKSIELNLFDLYFISCFDIIHCIVGDAQSQVKRNTLVQQYLVVFTVFESW